MSFWNQFWSLFRDMILIAGSRYFQGSAAVLLIMIGYHITTRTTSPNTTSSSASSINGDTKRKMNQKHLAPSVDIFTHAKSACMI